MFVFGFSCLIVALAYMAMSLDCWVRGYWACEREDRTAAESDRWPQWFVEEMEGK